MPDYGQELELGIFPTPEATRLDDLLGLVQLAGAGEVALVGVRVDEVLEHDRGGVVVAVLEEVLGPAEGVVRRQGAEGLLDAGHGFPFCECGRPPQPDTQWGYS